MVAIQSSGVWAARRVVFIEFEINVYQWWQDTEKCATFFPTIEEQALDACRKRQ